VGRAPTPHCRRGITERRYLDQPTLSSATATVLDASPQGIVLDRMVFYARSATFTGGSQVTMSLRMRFLHHCLWHSRLS
jgi:hypothetical protein